MGDEFKALVGTKLKEARVAAHMTQEDVAEELVCKRQTISSWEGGRTAPTLEEFRDLVTLYGVSADRVLYGFDAAAATQDALDLARKKGFVDSTM